jgi:hypothetical protein
MLVEYVRPSLTEIFADMSAGDALPEGMDCGG